MHNYGVRFADICVSITCAAALARCLRRRRWGCAPQTRASGLSVIPSVTYGDTSPLTGEITLDPIIMLY